VQLIGESVALASERQRQHATQRQVRVARVRWQSDGEALLRDPAKIGAMEDIPERKAAGEVAVLELATVGMVDAVQRRHRRLPR